MTQMCVQQAKKFDVICAYIHLSFAHSDHQQSIDIIGMPVMGVFVYA